MQYEIHIAKRRQGFRLSGWRVWGFKWQRVNKGAIVYRRQDGIYHAIRVRVTEALRVRVTECNSGYSYTSAAKTNLVKLVLCWMKTRGSFETLLLENIFINEDTVCTCVRRERQFPNYTKRYSFKFWNNL